MGVRESVVGRRSELAWSPTGEASQCKRDGDAAIGLTLSPHATQLVVVAPPPATPAPAPASAPCPSERCVAFTLRHRRRATDTTTLGLQNRFAVACWSPVAATTVPPTDGGSGAERSRAGVASLLRQPTPSIRPNRIPSHAYSSCAEAAINYYHSFSYKNKKKKRKRTDTLTSRSVVCATWRRIGEEGARLRRLAPTLTA